MVSSIGGFELIVILVILCLLALPITAGAIFLFFFLKKRNPK